MPGRPSVLAVIPARYGSTRLPGKPLAPLGGQPMVVRVAERVQLARRVHRILVATDDARIADAARAAGLDTVMTGAHASGTDRVLAAAGGTDADVVVNVQGDEPFLEPDVVDAVVAACDAARPIVTACTPLADPTDPNRVKVVTDAAGRALYFSRAPIPSGGPWAQHLGIYAFHRSVIPAVRALVPSPLERSERLEQLRWLGAGLPVHLVVVAHAAAGVDTPDDLARAQSAFARRAS